MTCIAHSLSLESKMVLWGNRHMHAGIGPLWVGLHFEFIDIVDGFDDRCATR